jgi:hypothetical protein
MHNNKNINLFNTSSFLNTINTQSNLYTNLVYTKQIISAIHLAEIMYLDLPNTNLVRKFISEVRNKSVKITGFINSNNKLESNNYSVFDSGMNTWKPNISKNTGVYLFTHTLTGKQYIGSAMNFLGRMQLHRQQVKYPLFKFHKFVSENTWNNFTFGTVYETTNYLTEFKYKYPKYNLSAGEMIILSHLTHLEARVLEQSLITEFHPKLNLLNKDVMFSYYTWNSSTLDLAYNLKNPNALTVEVWLEDTKEILTTYPSIQKTAESLGVSRELISRYLNKSSSFESTLLELNVYVKNPNSTIVNTPIVHPSAKKYPLIDYDISSLESDFIYVLNSDKSKIEYTFNTANLAAKTLDPSKFKDWKKGWLDSRYISRYLNQERLVKTELGSYYFVCNPNTLIKFQSKTKSKLTWVIDLTTGSALRFNSASAVLRHYKFKDNHAITRHLDRYTIYLNNYQFFSQDEFIKYFPNVQSNSIQCNLNKLPLKINNSN